MQLTIKSKKGLGMEFIITTSLLLISFFLIAGLLGRFASRTNDLEAELLCQTSIAQRARTAVQVGETSGFELKLAPNLCRTINTKVSGSREQVLREVSDKMARCWWMFNEGRYDEILDSFSSNGYLKILSVEGLGKNDCFNCYSVLIDQGEIPGGPIKAAEINEYLSTKTYAKVNKTYLDYIQGHGGPGRVLFTVPEILPQHGYTISMMPKNKAQSTFWTGAILGTIAGIIFPPAGVGAVFLGVGAGLAAEAREAYLTDPDYLNNVEQAYSERDVSSIYFGILETGQDLCGEGDIAGQ